MSALDCLDDYSLCEIMKSALPCIDDGSRKCNDCIRYMNAPLMNAYPRAISAYDNMMGGTTDDIQSPNMQIACSLVRAGLVDEFVEHISRRDLSLANLVYICSVIGTVEVDLMDCLLKAIKPYEEKWFITHVHDPDFEKLDSCYEYALMPSFRVSREKSWRSSHSHMEFVVAGFSASPPVYAEELAGYIFAHPQRLEILTSMAALAHREVKMDRALINALSERIEADDSFISEIRSSPLPRVLAVYFAVFGLSFVMRIMNMTESELIAWMRNGPHRQSWRNVSICYFMRTTPETMDFITKFAPAMVSAIMSRRHLEGVSVGSYDR